MKSYEELLQAMLERVPENIDKREGGVIFTALAPVAAMLAEQQCYADAVMNATLPDTARGDNLTRRCSELGVNRYPATKAIRKAAFTGAIVPAGTRFGAEGIIYTVIDCDKQQLECQQEGVVGNSYFGVLLPIDDIANLQTAMLADILAAGEEIETDEALRTRFYGAMSRQPFGGNIAQYKAELEKIAGVGAAKIFPTPNGKGGKVQCIIVDPSNQPVSTTLLTQVQEYIDPPPQGKGYGVAPIGHTVTISTVSKHAVNVSASVALRADYTLASLLPIIKQAITGYLDQLAFADNIVRVSHIEAAILSVNGVVDVRSATLNGQTNNLILSAMWNNYEVPTLGAVTLTEVS